MILFDSHCHLDDPVFKNDLGEVINRALNAGVMSMTVVGVDETTSLRAVSLANSFEGMYASVGFHPHNADLCNDDALDRLVEVSKHRKVVAWGEVGLDFNRMYSSRSQQESCFIRQIHIASDLRKPVILHERGSKGRMIEILDAHPHPPRSAVVHCFSGSRYEMEHYLKMGFYIGITGIVSMLKRGRRLRNIIKHVPIDKLLVETDAPYLTPAPNRNKTKRNEPALIKVTLLKLADARQENAITLAKQIWKNTCTFFGI